MKKGSRLLNICIGISIVTTLFTVVLLNKGRVTEAVSSVVSLPAEAVANVDPLHILPEVSFGEDLLTEVKETYTKSSSRAKGAVLCVGIIAVTGIIWWRYSREEEAEEAQLPEEKDVLDDGDGVPLVTSVDSRLGMPSDKEMQSRAQPSLLDVSEEVATEEVVDMPEEAVAGVNDEKEAEGAPLENEGFLAQVRHSFSESAESLRGMIFGADEGVPTELIATAWEMDGYDCDTEVEVDGDESEEKQTELVKDVMGFIKEDIVVQRGKVACRLERDIQGVLTQVDKLESGGGVKVKKKLQKLRKILAEKEAKLALLQEVVSVGGSMGSGSCTRRKSVPLVQSVSSGGEMSDIEAGADL